MIECYACGKKLEKLEFSERNIKNALLTRKRLWFDVVKPTKEDFAVLERLFNIHPITTEDCFTNETRVKVEVFDDDYLFYVLYGIREDADMRFIEMDMVLGKKFLITSHPKESKKLKELKDNPAQLEALMTRGVDFLFHHIIDVEIDNYLPIVEKLDDAVEELDRLCFKNPTRNVLVKLDALKDTIIHIRRKSFNQRDKLIILTREDTPFLSRDAKMYFRDVYDNAVHAADQLDGLREEISGTLNTYLSLVSNKMNDIMRTLTIIATIMMPLTVVGSIYGMNFRYMPELQWKYGYYAVLGFMLALSLIMIYFFKRKKWL